MKKTSTLMALVAMVAVAAGTAAGNPEALSHLVMAQPEGGPGGAVSHWAPGDTLAAYYTRLPFDDKHSGKYADIVVQLDEPAGQLVFGRESGYLPVWKNDRGAWPFNEIVPREGEGSRSRPDALNKYTYARILRSNPEEVLIHWRYLPNAEYPDVTRVVHEYFAISSEGRIQRTSRQGTRRIDDWNDPRNTAVQGIILAQDGVKELGFLPATPQRAPGKPVQGNPVAETAVGAPVAWWRFDEGLETRPYDREFETLESVSGVRSAIGGHKAFWKSGVSGTALAFDGYHSKVTLPAAQAPPVASGLTLDLWFALAAYPFNDTAVIQQFNHQDAGYFLGVTTYGNLSFKIALDSTVHVLVLDETLDVYRWTHVVATYDQAGGEMRIYVDGVLKGSRDVPRAAVTMSGSDLMIGVNNTKLTATDLVRDDNNIEQVLGIEALLDEVKVYDTALSTDEVEASYKALFPGSSITGKPNLQPRIMPGATGEVPVFGARYTNLAYHDLWDSMWRASEYQDLVIKFDAMPTSVVFWRGLCFSPAWVSENNKWMGDQSAEVGGPWGCAEHMADKEGRHSHVRLIENTPARVVAHWRHSCADISYTFEMPENWSDEYHTIYPDGVIMRHVNFHGGEEPTWHEPQLFSEAGTGPLDNIAMQAMSAANLSGDVIDLDWSDGPPTNPLEDAIIELYNLKSEYKVFGIFGDGTKLVTHGWFNTEQSPHTPDPFAGPWNHWPISKLLSDGRLVTAYDRLTSCALGEREGVTDLNIGMFGFTNGPVESLIPLAKSWNYPPELKVDSGCVSRGYDKAQRAYVIERRADPIAFSLEASDASPVVNPCFVVENWPGRGVEATLHVDGSETKAGLRQGVILDKNGDPALVLWLELASTENTRFSIRPLTD